MRGDNQTRSFCTDRAGLVPARLVLSGLVLAGLVLTGAGLGVLAPQAQAQSTEMDRCTSVDACDDVATDFIGKSALLLDGELYVEAAQQLYPVMLSDRVSPLIQAATRNQFSVILETAELFELAAEQKDIANSVTDAPASAELLERARLIAKAPDMREETLAAYADAEALAVRAANLTTIDAILSDYQLLGASGPAQALRARRAEAAGRADAGCGAVSCKTRALVDAKVAQGVQPAYPPRALAQGIGTDCRVRMNLTEDGQPVDIEAMCGDARFVESASAAARATVFQPRYRNGQPEPRYNVILPYTFAAN